MKSPDFWYKSPHALLKPFSWAYSFYIKCYRKYVTPKPLVLPSIVIGGVTIGGSGKTSTVIAIAKLLNNKKVHILSRGYGRYSNELIKVIPEYSHELVGDDPILLSKQAPTWVYKNRFISAKAAKENGAELVLLDDGLQNNKILANASILVIDGEQGIGNGFTLPAGPLREPLNERLSKVDGVVFIGEDKHNLINKIEIPILRADLIISGIPRKSDFYVAFCGTGYPNKFFNTLENAGVKLVKKLVFADHYNYKKKDIEEMLRYSKLLITTHKDFVRLPKSLRKFVQYTSIALKWRDEKNAKDFLEKIIKKIL